MPAALAASSRTRLATLLLIAVTAIWGSTFFLIKDLVATVPPTDFLALRFTIAAVAMSLVFQRQLRALSRRDVGLGLGLGSLYGLAQILQTVGLAHTDASVSGFITGTYVVLTPLLGAAIFRDRIPPRVWAAAALAMAGIGVLSLRGIAIGFGETLTLIAAAIYALHIIGLGRYARAESAVGLATVQAIAVAFICVVASIPGGVTLPATTGGWVSVVYMALVAGAFALWAQTWAQAHLTAARAAIVMSLEPVFAALFAVLFGGESFTARMLLGGSLVVAAMYLVELAPRRRPAATALEDPPVEVLHHEVP
ncbi:MAG: DMT family transporter [Dermatophilaceae bacterium]|nr:DMT family transporter [Intrasporangiaceae bacterium]